MVTTTVTVKFHRPTRERRREWQKAMRLYRDTKRGEQHSETGGRTMLGVTVWLANRVPRGIREPAIFLMPTVSRVEGGFDTATCAVKECRSNNDTRPMKESRESVPELRGNAQP